MTTNTDEVTDAIATASAPAPRALSDDAVEMLGRALTSESGGVHLMNGPDLGASNAAAHTAAHVSSHAAALAAVDAVVLLRELCDMRGGRRDMTPAENLDGESELERRMTVTGRRGDEGAIDLTPTDRARALTFNDTRLVAARELVDRYESCLRRGVPERPLLAVLHSQAAPNEAWKAAGRWRTGRGLYALSGPIGTGKTVAAARWAAFAGAAWVPACDAVAHTAQESLSQAPALVIDELGGHGSSSPLAVERIGATLSRRHAERKPTLITTNLNRDDFGRLFDGDAGASRILNRIDEDGEWVVCLTRMRQRMEPTTERIDAARELLRLWPIVLDTRDDDGGATARSMDRLQAMLELDEDELHRRAADARASQARIGDLVASLGRKIAAMSARKHGGWQ